MPRTISQTNVEIVEAFLRHKNKSTDNFHSKNGQLLSYELVIAKCDEQGRILTKFPTSHTRTTMRHVAVARHVFAQEEGIQNHIYNEPQQKLEAGEV